MPLHFLLGFMVEVLAIVIVAKLVRDAILKRRGSDVNEQVTRQKSAGAAIAQTGYLIGVLLGTLGAVAVTDDTTRFLGIVAFVALAGLVAIVLQLLADLLSSALVFRGLGGAGAENANVALAVGKAAVSVATGLVLRGAMSDPEIGLLGRIAWFAAGQAVMVLAVLLYCRLTPYDDLGEIKKDNLAAGFPIAGILLAVGLVMEAAIAGKSTGAADRALVASILEFAKFLGVSLVLVYLFRLITDRLMLPKVKLANAVVDERNVGAGVQEGASFLLASLIVTFFLS